jgi:hypothetical protein
MALDTFTFAIALPPGPDSLAMFREVSGLMSRYIGLPESEARNAGAALDKLVEERLTAGGTVEVTFVRSSGDEVTVDVTGPALPGDEAIGEKAGAIAIAHLDGTRSRMRLVWTVGRDL